MNSKNLEDVRKRRAKPSKIRLNVYQKMVLVAGALALFLTIGISSAMAPFLAAGVVIGTLFLLWVLKNLKPKKEEQKIIASVETLTPIYEKEGQRQDIYPVEDEEKVFPDSPGILFEEKEVADGQGNLLEKQEEVAREERVLIQEAILPGKESLKDLHEDPENETLADIKQRLAFLEEKVAILEGILMSLEEKPVCGEETELKSGSQIDLETVLSNTDEKPPKKADEPHRSILIIR